VGYADSRALDGGGPAWTFRRALNYRRLLFPKPFNVRRGGREEVVVSKSLVYLSQGVAYLAVLVVLVVFCPWAVVDPGDGGPPDRRFLPGILPASFHHSVKGEPT